MANNHETTTYFGTGDNSNCLVQAACSILVTIVMSVGGKADFSMLVINITSDTTGERYFTAMTIKRVFSSFHRQAPRAKQLAHHMITSWLLMAVGAIALSVNSTLEQSVGPVVYN